MDDDDYIGGGSEVSVNGGDGESAVNSYWEGPVCGKKAQLWLCYGLWGGVGCVPLATR